MPPVEVLWTQVEPPATRLTRSELAAETENYLKAVSRSDGSLVKFNRQSCLRLENGNVMAYGPNDVPVVPLQPVTDPDSRAARSARPEQGLRAATEHGHLCLHHSYDHARFPVIDVERQVLNMGARCKERSGVTLEASSTVHGFMRPEREPARRHSTRDGRITRVQGVFLNSNV
jgi:hypothetical protein